MRTLTIKEARQVLSHLDRLLELEGELTITRRGEPIARIIQIGKKRTMPSHRNLRESMPMLSSGSNKLIRENRDSQ